MQTHIPNVVLTRDGGYDCYDTTVTAREIARSFTYGLITVDPDRQRGRNTVSGRQVLKRDKIERWARELQEDKAIFGQLTWNFRPGESDIEFQPDPNDPNRGTLVVRDCTAYLPDSVHRHDAIRLAVESVNAGSSFDPGRRFSLRIWLVPEEYENAIFYAMNVEHDKADATRSKWLSQKNVGQVLAAQVVRSSPHLGEDNVETVSNSLSKRNPRLAAFNTIANGFEASWGDFDGDQLPKITKWFCVYWDKLVDVLPELGKIPLSMRQEARGGSLSSWAIAIHGYIRLARRFYDEQRDLELLEALADKGEENGKAYDFFVWDNPEWQRRGIVVPTIDRQGKQRLTVRNSHQSRRAMEAALADKIGITTPADEA